MSLFIHHDAEVCFDELRHFWDEVSAAALRLFDGYREMERAAMKALVREAVQEFRQQFVVHLVAALRHERDRKARRRKNAARARCGYRP